MRSFCPIRWRASSRFGEGGWQYSIDFNAKFNDEKSPLHYCRRRLWYRILHGVEHH